MTDMSRILSKSFLMQDTYLIVKQPHLRLFRYSSLRHLGLYRRYLLLLANFQKRSMPPQVLGELWMESSGKYVALPNCNNHVKLLRGILATQKASSLLLFGVLSEQLEHVSTRISVWKCAYCGEHFHLGAHFEDGRRANKYSGECLLVFHSYKSRSTRRRLHLDRGAVDLTAEKVATNVNVQTTDQTLAAIGRLNRVIREQNHTSTGAICWSLRVHPLAKCWEEPTFLAHYRHCCRLSTRQNETIKIVEILGILDYFPHMPQLCHHANVFTDGALDSQHSNQERIRHLST